MRAEIGTRGLSLRSCRKYDMYGRTSVMPLTEARFSASLVRSIVMIASLGLPKFTDQVQHFLYKVLRWDRSMNSFHWNNVVPLPGIAKPGKQSAKSRQLWIARHRL